MSNPATTPEPPPQRTDSPAVWPLVIAATPHILNGAPLWLVQCLQVDQQARHEDGCVRYGMPLTADNGRRHTVDAYQEALDGSAFARAEYERAGNSVWLDISDDFVRLCARIKYQLALEAEGEG